MLIRFSLFLTPAILAVALLSAAPAAAQELDLSAEVTMDALNPAQRDFLRDFKTKLEEYVSQRRWTDTDFYGDRIPVRLSVNFLSGTSSGEFTAQIVVDVQRRVWASGRPTQETSLIMRLLDQKWTFVYTQGQPFVHDEYQYNDITSLLDFYVYIILGMDFDSYEPLAGTPHYQKALRASQFALTGRNSSEWQGTSNTFSRVNLIAELNNAQYEKFRTAMYWFYYEGIDGMAEDKETSQRAVAKGLEDIADILARTNARSILIATWLEAKSSEFCRLLEGYPKRPALMNALMQADPQRSERYRQCAF